MAWLNKRSLAISIIFPAAVYITVFFLGWLRGFEYNLYDWYKKFRLSESKDSRIVIVGITEEDLRKLNQTTLDDGTLVKVLQKIKTQQPKVIGLDLHRNMPVCFQIDSCQSDSDELASIFRHTPNLIGIEKTTAGNLKEKAILPHPELAKAERTSASEIIEDRDRLVRRGYFYLTKKNQENLLSFGAAVALKFLETEDIPLVVEGTNLKLNNAVFKITPNKPRFYAAKEIGGYQILLHYRHNNNTFKQLSISQILEDDFSEEDLRDKIVLIGAVYELSKDIFGVPHFRPGENFEDFAFGVEIHAQLVSYLIDAAWGERTVLKFLPNLVENLLVIVLLFESCLLICWLNNREKKALKLLILMGVQIAVIWAGGWVSLYFWGYWLPGANLLFITAINLAVLGTLIYQNSHEEEKLKLEKQVQRKTQDLQKALKDLTKITREVIKQEKLDFFLASTAFLDHEIKNPLGLILLSSDAVTAQAYSLIEYLEEDISQDNLEAIKEITAEIIVNNKSIHDQVYRVRDLLALIDTQSYQKQEDLSPQNIDDLLKKVCSVAWHTFKRMISSELQVEIEIIPARSNSLEGINIYPKSLEVALVNILNNGLYSLFQKKQEDQLDSNFKPKLQVASKKTRDYLVISIEDNGVGIDNRDCDEIFKEFYSTKENSLGLGLFITKQLIEARHRGSINVESKLGVFTRFTIKIPLNLS